jgi:hypothetical protein
MTMTAENYRDADFQDLLDLSQRDPFDLAAEFKSHQSQMNKIAGKMNDIFWVASLLFNDQQFNDFCLVSEIDNDGRRGFDVYVELDE